MKFTCLHCWRVWLTLLANRRFGASLWSQSGCRPCPHGAIPAVLWFFSERSRMYAAECMLLREEQWLHFPCKKKGECSHCDSEPNYGRVFCSVAFSDKRENSFSPFHHFLLIKLTCLLPRWFLPTSVSLIFLAPPPYLGSQVHKNKYLPWMSCY